MLVGVREGQVPDGVAVVGEIVPHLRTHHQVEFLAGQETIGHRGTMRVQHQWAPDG